MAYILGELAKKVEAMDRDIYSTSGKQPGLALRMDRIEGHLRRSFAIVQWIGGGGLIGLVATAVLLYRILQVLPGAAQ